MDDSLKRLATEIINNNMMIDIILITKNLEDEYNKYDNDKISYDVSIIMCLRKKIIF